MTLDGGGWLLGGGGTESVQELAEGGLARGRLVCDGFAAVNFADGFDGLGVFLFLALELVAGVAEGTAAVAEFVEFDHFIADAAERGDQGEALLGVEVGAEDELGVAGGHDLEADFGEASGVIVKEIGEVILLEAGFEGEGLLVAPLAVAAAGDPVGDVAGGEFEAAVGQGGGDGGMGDGVGEHVVDQVAFEFRQVGDFAVAGFGFESAGGRRLGRWSGGVME